MLMAQVGGQPAGGIADGAGPAGDQEAPLPWGPCLPLVCQPGAGRDGWSRPAWLPRSAGVRACGPICHGGHRQVGCGRKSEGPVWNWLCSSWKGSARDQKRLSYAPLLPVRLLGISPWLCFQKDS